jgi:hypothetical protein
MCAVTDNAIKINIIKGASFHRHRKVVSYLKSPFYIVYIQDKSNIPSEKQAVDTR